MGEYAKIQEALQECHDLVVMVMIETIKDSIRIMYDTSLTNQPTKHDELFWHQNPLNRSESKWWDTGKHQARAQPKFLNATVRSPFLLVLALKTHQNPWLNVSFWLVSRLEHFDASFK